MDKPIKLRCISNKYQTNPEMPRVPIGNEVTAIDERVWNSKQYWMLAEYNDDWPMYWFHKADFATLPDQEPSVVNEEEKEALIYQR